MGRRDTSSLQNSKQYIYKPLPLRDRTCNSLPKSQLQKNVTNSKKSDNHYLHQVNIKINIKSDVLFIAFPSLIIALSWWRYLHNSMKLWAMMCGATEDEQVMMESSEKMTSTGGGNDKSLQYSCLKNPTNNNNKKTTPWTVWKGKKRWHLEMSPPGQKVFNMLLRKSAEIAPERIKRMGQMEMTQSCGYASGWK